MEISSGYGLMAKGGAGETLQKMIALNRDHLPNYLVTDDPRFTAFTSLTREQESQLYPGFDLDEIVSPEESGWGYSWGEVPLSTMLGEDESDYKARAVVGILSSREPN